MKKRVFIFALILSLGFFIRGIFLRENLMFGFEQGRDFEIAKNISEFKKFVLIGPKTDIEGVYHGAFYYYLLAFFFFISRGNPLTVATIFIVISSTTIITMYFVAKKFVPKRYALLASLLTAVSFNPVIYSRWISNVSLSLPLSAIYLFVIFGLIKTKNTKLLPTAAFCCGLFLHFEILNIFSGLIILLSAIILLQKTGKKISIKVATLSFVFFSLSILPFIIFNFKHQNILLSNLDIYFFQPKSSDKMNLLSNLSFYFMGIHREISTTLFPFFPKLAILFYPFGLIVFYQSFRNKRKRDAFLLLLIFMFSSFPLIFLLKGQSMEQFFSGTSILIIIFFVFLIERFLKRFHLQSILVYFVFIIYLFFMIRYDFQHLKSLEGVYYHMPYKEITFGKQRKIFNYILASHEPYLIDAFTTPLYRPEGWHYLNSFYSNQKNVNTYRGEPKKIYLIIEPFTYQFWLKIWRKDYDKISKLIETKHFDSITVEIRKPI
jgi:hypothetical protein